MLTCDCGSRPEGENGSVNHEPGCIHWDLEPVDPADEYGLYARYGL